MSRWFYTMGLMTVLCLGPRVVSQTDVPQVWDDAWSGSRDVSGALHHADLNASPETSVPADPTTIFCVSAVADEAFGNDCGDRVYNGLWYDYVAPVSGELSVQMCEVTFDAKLVIWRETGTGGLQAIACSTRTARPCGAAGGTLTVGVLVGERVLIQVGRETPGDSEACGTLRLSLHACPCEYDGAPSIEITDLLAFLVALFEADALADVNQDGVLSIVDLLFFLECWFSDGAGLPCPS